MDPTNPTYAEHLRGEDPRILSRPGRVIQRILQALTGRHREV